MDRAVSVTIFLMILALSLVYFFAPSARASWAKPPNRRILLGSGSSAQSDQPPAVSVVRADLGEVSNRRRATPPTWSVGQSGILPHRPLRPSLIRLRTEQRGGCPAPPPPRVAARQPGRLCVGTPDDPGKRGRAGDPALRLHVPCKMATPPDLEIARQSGRTQSNPLGARRLAHVALTLPLAI